MQIVIDIPEDAYDNLITYGYKNLGSFDAGNILKRVEKGTPLPKDHGRLIDEDDINFPVDIHYGWEALSEVEGAPTIIEADKEK